MVALLGCVVNKVRVYVENASNSFHPKHTRCFSSRLLTLPPSIRRDRAPCVAEHGKLQLARVQSVSCQHAVMFSHTFVLETLHIFYFFNCDGYRSIGNMKIIGHFSTNIFRKLFIYIHSIKIFHNILSKLFILYEVFICKKKKKHNVAAFFEFFLFRKVP